MINLLIDCSIELINIFVEITKDAYKSTVVTISGCVAGYTPELVAKASGNPVTTNEIYIQYAVWAVTLIVGIFAIINAIQKQIDRHHERKHKKAGKK